MQSLGAALIKTPDTDNQALDQHLSIKAGNVKAYLYQVCSFRAVPVSGRFPAAGSASAALIAQQAL